MPFEEVRRNRGRANKRREQHRLIAARNRAYRRNLLDIAGEQRDAIRQGLHAMHDEKISKRAEELERIKSDRKAMQEKRKEVQRGGHNF